MRIAVVDDDPAQLDLLQAIVGTMGHDCNTFGNGASLMQLLKKETFDLYVIDWELPDTSGPVLVKAIRDISTTPVPILMVTNRSDERDIVDGLACGADDYMVKSARVGELRARMMALLRRGGHMPASNESTWGAYRFLAHEREVWMNGSKVETLTHKEFDLALLAFRNLGRLLSRGYLIEAVWGRNADISSRSLDVYMSHVRRKLALRAMSGFRLVSVYNHGYRLEEMNQNQPADATAPA